MSQFANTLSTGEDQRVYLTTQGGEFRLFELEMIDGCFTRTIDATSQAWARFKVTQDCCDDVKFAQIWSTELEWYRDGDLVWAGPIRQVTYDGDEIQLIASDISAFWDFRYMPSYTNRGDVAQLFAEVIEVGLSEQPLKGMNVISSLVGRQGSIVVAEDENVTISAVVKELADSDIDWTVIGRNVFVYNPDLQSGVNNPQITLTDDCWDAPPKVVQRGDSDFATSIVAVGGNNQTVKATSPKILLDQYGLIERTVDFSFISDRDQLQRAAESWLSFLSQPFYVESTSSARLVPGKACPFDLLLPGLLVNTQIQHLCFDFNATMRIQNVQNCINGDVKIGMEPVGSLL